MNDHKGVWQELNELMFWAVFLYITVRLFQRRLDSFAEKLWGFLLCGTVAYASFFTVAGLTGTSYHGRPVILYGGLLFTLAVGMLWVVYSARTWEAAHGRAVLQAEKAAKQRKERNRARVRNYLTDVLP